MPTHTMTIADITHPKPDKKRGAVKGTDGARFGCFAEKIGLFEIGKTYEIEHTDGEYKNVTSAKPAVASVHSLDAARAAAAPATSSPPRDKEFGWQTHPVDAERMFVCSTLNAFIAAGKVSLDSKELAAATIKLRGLWNYTFVSNSRAEPEQRRAQG